MSADNLVSLKSPLNATIKPRSSAHQSLPTLMTVFQNEWKELLLETYNLKIQLQNVKQELNNSIFQYEAACRVIDRLKKEKEKYKKEVELIKSMISESTTQ